MNIHLSTIQILTWIAFLFIGKPKISQLYLWGGAVRTVLCRTRACDELKVRSEIIHDKYLFDYLRLSWIWIVWRRLLDCCKCCNWSRFVSIIWNRERYWKSGEHIAVYLTPIPQIARILVPGKTASCKIRVSWTVLMTDLEWNSPTNAYTSQRPRKWKPQLWKQRNAGTSCIIFCPSIK